MSVTINGTGSISGISAGGISSNQIGKVLQVSSTIKSDSFSSATTGWIDVTGLSVTITPTSSTSTILINAVVGGAGQTSTTNIQIRLVRDSTAIDIGNAASNRTQCSGYLNQGTAADLVNFCAMTYLDSPATTSSITYKVQVRNNNSSGTIYINRSSGDSDAAGYSRTPSTITVMEVAA